MFADILPYVVAGVLALAVMMIAALMRVERDSRHIYRE